MVSPRGVGNTDNAAVCDTDIKPPFTLWEGRLQDDEHEADVPTITAPRRPVLSNNVEAPADDDPP